MASREGRSVVTPNVEEPSILVQTVEYDRQIAIYSYNAPDHPEGHRTLAVLQVDDGVVTDQYGRRLSA